MARARSEPAAFGQLYEHYVDRVYSYIYHRVGNVQDAEDLTARTFYRALDRLDTYEDRGLPFAAWLFRIAHNLVANWHRDHGQRRFLSLDRLWWRGTDGARPRSRWSSAPLPKRSSRPSTACQRSAATCFSINLAPRFPIWRSAS